MTTAKPPRTPVSVPPAARPPSEAAPRGTVLRSPVALCCLGLAVAGLAAVAGPAGAAKVAKHALFTDDGTRLRAKEPLQFAILGDTRGRALPADATSGAVVVGKKVSQEIVADVAADIAGENGTDLLVMMGDHVRAGIGPDWKSFDKLMAPVLEGTTAAKGGGKRVGAVPVVGDYEGISDPRYTGWGAAWPEVGADVGFGRVGSWYSFDLESLGYTWRFVVLDGNKEALGSRWTEQIGWIERSASKGKFDGLVVLMHLGLVDLGGREPDMNRGEAPQELLETLEDAIGLSRLRAVVFGGHGACQAVMPGGPLGTLHIGAGCGGGPTQHLRRWTAADAAGMAKDIPLEPIFDLSLMNQLDRWNRDVGLPEVAVDEAKARNSFQGFTAAYNPRHFPVQGWWKGEVAGEKLSFTFRFRRLDGRFVDIYSVSFSDAKGWMPRKLDGK